MNGKLRPFFTIWTGQAFSLLGSQLVQFAIVWWLTRQTGSATVLALASLAALLPQILLGPFAGALVDRWSRRRVMLAADTATALATLVLALLFWLDLAAVWMIYTLLMVRAAGAAFHWPAMQASTTLMVPGKHLARVAGLNQVLVGLAGIFIPPLGALAVERLPMQGVLAIDVVSAVPAIVPLLFIQIPQPDRATARGTEPVGGSYWADLREGLRFVAGWPGLMLTTGWGILIHMLGRAAGALTPLLIIKHFQAGAVELGWFLSIGGIGGLLGGLILGVWGGFRRKILTQIVFMILNGLVVIAIGLSPPNAVMLALVFFLLSAVLETIVVGLSGALAQSIIPPEMQGRLFGLSISLTQALAPLGLLAAGPTADALGVPFWYVLTGILFTLSSIAAFLIPSVSHIEEPAYQPYRVLPVVDDEEQRNRPA